MTKSPRRLLDKYMTASYQVDALVDNCPEISGHIWCPCVGDGSLINQLVLRRPDLTVFTNDIDDQCIADHHGDATDYQCWVDMLSAADDSPDWIIENPPFNGELAILEHAYTVATCGVIFMARVSFSEPTHDRGPWLSAHPYDKRITLERYSFTGNGKSDSATTDWLIWSKVSLSGPFGISAYGYKPR